MKRRLLALERKVPPPVRVRPARVIAWRPDRGEAEPVEDGALVLEIIDTTPAKVRALGEELDRILAADWDGDDLAAEAAVDDIERRVAGLEGANGHS